MLEALTVSIAARGAGVDLEGLDLSLAAQLRTDEDAYLDYALRLPQRLAAADDRPMVVFIDEFQDLIRIGDGDYAGGSEALTRRLRAVFQDAPAVGFLFAGSIEHMMRDLVSNPDAAFFEFGTIMALSPITRDEWREGLAERYARDRTRIDDDALARLIDLGDGHPRATMLLAQQAHLAAILAGSRHVTLPLTEAALLEAMRSERKRHETLVEHVQTLGPKAVRRYTLPVAHALASGRAARRGVRRDHETSRVIKALRDAGIVAGYDRDSLRIVDPLFARYLRALPLPQPL
jgi:hypothetical protein